MSFAALVAHERARVLSARCSVAADVADRLRRAVAAEMLRRSLSWSAFAAEAGVGKATAYSWRNWICGTGSPTIASAERAARWLDANAAAPPSKEPNGATPPIDAAALRDAVLEMALAKGLGLRPCRIAGAAGVDEAAIAALMRHDRIADRDVRRLHDWVTAT
jgi:hypothetical protein